MRSPSHCCPVDCAYRVILCVLPALTLSSSWRRRCLGYVIVVLVLLSGMVTGANGEFCQDVQNRCFNRDGCRLALQSYWTHCTLVTNGAGYHCTPECTKALIMLLTSEEQGGEDFVNCDCEGQDFCLQQKSRIEVCQHEVQRALQEVNGDDTQITCSLAWAVCAADTECLAALHYFDHHCQKLFRGEGCSSRCNNSLSILFRQRKAKKLRSCRCDGEDHLNCLQKQTHMQRLCFHGASGPAETPRHSEPRHHHHRHNHTRSHHNSTHHGQHPDPDANYDNADNAGGDNGCNPKFEVNVVGKSINSAAQTLHSANRAQRSQSLLGQTQTVIATLTLLLLNFCDILLDPL